MDVALGLGSKVETVLELGLALAEGDVSWGHLVTLAGALGGCPDGSGSCDGTGCATCSRGEWPRRYLRPPPGGHQGIPEEKWGSAASLPWIWPEHGDGRARAYPMVVCLEIKPRGDRPQGKGCPGLTETRAHLGIRGPWVRAVGKAQLRPGGQDTCLGPPGAQAVLGPDPHCWRLHSPRHTCCPVGHLEPQPPAKELCPEDRG